MKRREELMETIKVVTGFDKVEEERNVAWILDLACRNEAIARGVRKHGQSGLCRRKGQPGICIFPSHIHQRSLSNPHVFDL